MSEPTREQRLRKATHAAHDRAILTACDWCRSWYVGMLAINVDRFVAGRDDFDVIDAPPPGDQHDKHCPLFKASEAAPKAKVIDIRGSR